MEGCGNVSFINFLGLNDGSYGNYAKGILYVICEIFGKIMIAVGKLIDVITGLFYKIAGANYLGSGNENLIEEQDLLSQLFNQNIVSNVSLFMILASFVLMAVFGVSAVVKQMFFSKDERKSMTDVIKNMVLAFIFLIALGPIAMFAISSISTITTSIIGIFGDTSSISLADLIFNASFNGDVISTYNSLYTTEIVSWVEIENNFIFDIIYGETSTDVTFYWYIFLLGGGVVLFNLIVMIFKLIKRIFTVIILYLTAPVYVARMVDDGGVKFKEWKNKALSELISIVGTTIAFMVLISLVGIINDIELVEATKEVAAVGGEIKALADEVVVNETALLINNLTKILLIMAGTSVAKDSGELLGNIFKSSADDNGVLLEGIFNRLGAKETHASVKSESSGPKTRVITRTTTSTKKVINYNESVPVAPMYDSNKGTVNVVNNQRNSFNNTINKIDRHINNIQTRASVNVDDRDNITGAKRGNYRDVGQGEQRNPADLLNQNLAAGYMQETDKIRNEWEFMKNKNSSSSQVVVKEFESASKDLDASISSGEQNRIKNSMNMYVEAYRNEEKVAKAEYKDFAGKSTKLSSDLSAKQQEELRNISNAYRKAQVDYGKTARKLSEVSAGNMSAADALRIKERADKQREKLMEASSKANDFYNNQKKGV